MPNFREACHRLVWPTDGFITRIPAEKSFLGKGSVLSMDLQHNSKGWHLLGNHRNQSSKLRTPQDVVGIGAFAQHSHTLTISHTHTLISQKRVGSFFLCSEIKFPNKAQLAPYPLNQDMFRNDVIDNTIRTVKPLWFTCVYIEQGCLLH